MLFLSPQGKVKAQKDHNYRLPTEYETGKTTPNLLNMTIPRLNKVFTLQSEISLFMSYLNDLLKKKQVHSCMES